MSVFRFVHPRVAAFPSSGACDGGVNDPAGDVRSGENSADADIRRQHRYALGIRAYRGRGVLVRIATAGEFCRGTALAAAAKAVRMGVHVLTLIEDLRPRFTLLYVRVAGVGSRCPAPSYSCLLLPVGQVIISLMR